MKYKHSSTSYFPEVESVLTQAFASDGALLPQARQRIWHTALERAGQLARPVQRSWRWVFYPGVAAMLVVAFLSGYVGVVFAAGASIPGEPLYAIERGAEVVWLRLTPTSQRTEVQLALLQRRIYEARALLDAGRDVPPDLFQEIALLFEAVAEESMQDLAQTVPLLNEEALVSLIFYRDTLTALTEYHAGVRGLEETAAIADEIVAALGGAPLKD
ncbi:MAG: hypothetical protein JXA33_08345 [Anaerolineae bacterium]|nr:hypothetical protein [Anaerolineae bacterium]